jgi:hypothetical protein
VNRFKRTVVWGLALACALVFASIAMAAAPKIKVAASFTYSSAGAAVVCVKVTGPPKTVLRVTVSGAAVNGVKTKTVRIGAKRVTIVRFTTSTPAGYNFVVIGRLGTSAKATKRAGVNLPQPGTEASQGVFSCA